MPHLKIEIDEKTFQKLLFAAIAEKINIQEYVKRVLKSRFLISGHQIFSCYSGP